MPKIENINGQNKIYWDEDETYYINDPNNQNIPSNAKFLRYKNYSQSDNQTTTWSNKSYDNDTTWNTLESITFHKTAEPITIAKGDMVQADVILRVQDTNGNMSEVHGYLELKYGGFCETGDGSIVLQFLCEEYNSTEQDLNKYNAFMKAMGQYISTKETGFRNIGITDSSDFNSDDGVTSGPLIASIPDHFNCFLEGSLILMKTGLVKVENIKVGDFVCTFNNGKRSTKKILAVSKNLVTTFYKDNFPVCIKKDAFKKNIPFQDLYVTSEHCLFIDHCFIPARMLVNNRSIVWGNTQSSYYVYHIETEQHSVIKSNGLLSESYLNTDQSFGKTHKTWEKDAAAPLNVTQKFVEPIYKTLEKRAIRLKFPSVAKDQKLTTDPDFYIMTKEGEPFFPLTVNKGRYLFNIPENTDKIFLVSRASRPYDTVGHFIDDRRYLGLLIGEIHLISKSNIKEINEHLVDKNLSGWNNLESSANRWTNGNGELPLPKISKKSLLSVQVLSTTVYIDYGIITEKEKDVA